MPKNTQHRLAALLTSAALMAAVAVPVVAGANSGPQPEQIHAQIHA